MTITISEPVWQFLLNLVKILVFVNLVMIAVPFMVLLERKLIARIQHRVGPNRVGPWGLLQTIVDGIKLFLKEDIVPDAVDRPLHTIAPMFNLVPAIMLLAIIPFGPLFHFNPASLNLSLLGLSVVFPDLPDHVTALGIADLEIGILFYLALTGVSVYGIVLAGWASNCKYSLLGGIRSTAQMVSYELVLGLSVLGVLLIASTLNLRDIIAQQSPGIWHWNMVTQPMGFLLFMTAGFAETNRLPFDLPEGESELGGGFHTEYSSMKFAVFFMAEYMMMFTFAAILATLFLGGFHAPIPALMLGQPGSLLYGLSGMFWLGFKIFLMLCFMIFIRGTLPRFRYDQLMDFGWKMLLPLALVNLVVTAIVIAVGPSLADSTSRDPLPLVLIGGLLAVGVFQLWATDYYLTQRKKRLLAHAG